MLSPASVTEEDLQALADGTLESGRHAAVARRVAAEPELARRVAHYRAQSRRLEALFAACGSPVPLRFRALVAAARRTRAP